MLVILTRYEELMRKIAEKFQQGSLDDARYACLDASRPWLPGLRNVLTTPLAALLLACLVIRQQKWVEETAHVRIQTVRVRTDLGAGTSIQELLITD